jgi:N-acetylglucosamine-6-phosphate deacetylase
LRYSNATYEEAIHSFDNGITAVTHLYNAMTLCNTAPCLVGATFNHQQQKQVLLPMVSMLIMLLWALQRRSCSSGFAITDAVTSTTAGFYQLA